jgi:hypothetical protein
VKQRSREAEALNAADLAARGRDERPNKVFVMYDMGRKAGLHLNVGVVPCSVHISSTKVPRMRHPFHVSALPIN